MTINYTHTEPSRSHCRRFHTWCVMANGLGNCSNTACYYGYDRIKANYFGKDAQKRQLKMSTVTNPCEVDAVPTNDLVYRPNNPYPYGKEITTGTPLPPQGVTVTCKKE